MKRWMVIGLGVVGMVAGVGLARGEGKLPFLVSKEATGMVGPLREDGRVDYVGALNEKYGKEVLPEENGFVAWLGVVGTGEKIFFYGGPKATLALLGVTRIEMGGEVWGSYYDYLYSGQAQTDDVEKDDLKAEGEEKHVWKKADDPRFAGYLENQKGLLARVEEVSRKGKWWVPVVSREGELSDKGYPSLNTLRQVAGVLCARGMMRAGEGDAAGFVEDMGTVKRLARLVGSGPSYLEGMVSVGMERDVNRMVGAAVGTGAFTEEQCVAIGKVYDGFGELRGVREAVDGFERWTVLDFAERVAMRGEIRAEEVGDEGKAALRTIEWEEVDWNQVLRRINRHYDEMGAALRAGTYGDLRKRFGELERDVETWMEAAGDERAGMLSKRGGETREAYSERVGETLLAMKGGWYGRGEELHRQAGMEREMVDVVLRAAEEKGRAGKWPVEVKGLPVDIYSVGGKEVVRYVVREGGVEVYSVGANGRDDGGVHGGERRADDVGVGAVPEVGEK